MSLFTAKYTDRVLASSPELGVLVFMKHGERGGWQRMGKGVLSPSSLGKRRPPPPKAHLCVCLTAAPGSFLHFSGHSVLIWKVAVMAPTQRVLGRVNVITRVTAYVPPQRNEGGGQVPFYGIPERNICL